MARSIYVTSPEGDTGKSMVALGLVDLLARTVQRVGVFRPVARSDGRSATTCSSSCSHHDGVDLTYDECVGVTYEQVHARPRGRARADRVPVPRRRARGATPSSWSAPTTRTSPARPSWPTTPASPRTSARRWCSSSTAARPQAGASSRRWPTSSSRRCSANHAQVVSVVANRCAAGLGQRRRATPCATAPACRSWAVPGEPAAHRADRAPAVWRPCDGTLIAGDEDAAVARGARRHRRRHVRRAPAGRLTDGSVVITPGDRSDVLLGLLMAHQADGFPSLAGIILNGGFRPRAADRAPGRRARQPAADPLHRAGHVPVGERGRRHARAPHGRLAAQGRHRAVAVRAARRRRGAAGRARRASGPRWSPR